MYRSHGGTGDLMSDSWTILEDGIRHCGQWQGHWCQAPLYIVDAYYEHLGTGCYAIVDLYYDDVDCSGVCQQDMDLYFMVDALQDAYWDVMQHHLWLMPVVALGLPSMHWWDDLSHWCIMFQMLYMWFCTCYLCMIDRVMPFDAMIGWYISLHDGMVYGQSFFIDWVIFRIVYCFPVGWMSDSSCMSDDSFSRVLMPWCMDILAWYFMQLLG